MSTAAEFTKHRFQDGHGRSDEQAVRVLFVEDRLEFAERVRENLGRCPRGSFEVVRETDLVDAAAKIQGDEFDLLMIDLSLGNVDRTAAIELANDLAHRIPVVVLTGTEALAEQPGEGEAGTVRCIEHADVAGKLLNTIRRYRRLGTAVMTPVFCRLGALRP